MTRRFISADIIVPEPGNPQALNRYAYVMECRNNVLGRIDLGIPMGPSSSYGDGKFYSSMMARHESVQIVWCWLSEQCEPQLYMGPYSAMPREIMIDPQVVQVGAKWAARDRFEQVSV